MERRKARLYDCDRGHSEIGKHSTNCAEHLSCRAREQQRELQTTAIHSCTRMNRGNNHPPRWAAGDGEIADLTMPLIAWDAPEACHRIGPRQGQADRPQGSFRCRVGTINYDGEY